VFPTKNFRDGFQFNWERVTAAEYKKLRVAEVGCYSCMARCGKVHEVTSGPYAGAKSEGPEYESMWAFTGTIDNTDIGATIAADSMSDQLGMDTISAGSTIGMAYELYEKGIITKEDTDGLELTYGNHAAMITLLKKIAYREGFGNVLAEGSRGAARIIGKGSEYYAMQVKGLEMAAYEPRGLKATGYGYATSNIGAAHGNGSLAFQEWGMPVPRAVDRFEDDGKADIVIYNQNNAPFNEFGMICAFFNSFGGWPRVLIPKMFVAATGIQEFGDMKYLAKAGERVLNLERAFNVREGISRKDDTLPERLQKEPLHTHGRPGEGQTVPHLEKFLDDYYRLRGWTDNGIPSREKLQELQLDSVIQDMEPFYSK
jgi:aldehyde:ferredoxin oxidoreductase